METTERNSANVNPLTTKFPNHIETSQFICTANQLTGFYMMGRLALNDLE